MIDGAMHRAKHLPSIRDRRDSDSKQELQRTTTERGVVIAFSQQFETHNSSICINSESASNTKSLTRANAKPSAPKTATEQGTTVEFRSLRWKHCSSFLERWHSNFIAPILALSKLEPLINARDAGKITAFNEQFAKECASIRASSHPNSNDRVCIIDLAKQNSLKL
jgi:hypothetical protein